VRKNEKSLLGIVVAGVEASGMVFGFELSVVIYIFLRSGDGFWI